MGLLVSDTFTEASNTDLASHTPDTGTGWTEEIDTNGSRVLRVIASSDTLAPSATTSNNALFYSSQPDPTEADVDVEIDVAVVGSNLTAPSVLVARYADSNNFYSAGSYHPSSTADKKIFKRVSGLDSEIASGDNGLSNGDTLKLEIRGGTLKLYQNGSEVLSTPDSAISAAGKAGFGTGSLWVSTDDYANNWDWDNYVLTEFASGVANPTRRTLLGTG